MKLALTIMAIMATITYTACSSSQSRDAPPWLREPVAMGTQALGSGTFAVPTSTGAYDLALDPADSWICVAEWGTRGGVNVSVYLNTNDNYWHLASQAPYGAAARCVQKSAFPEGTVFSTTDLIEGTYNGINGGGTGEILPYNIANTVCMALTIWGPEDSPQQFWSGSDIRIVRPVGQSPYWVQEAYDVDNHGGHWFRGECITYPGSPSGLNGTTYEVGSGFGDSNSVALPNDSTAFCGLSMSSGQIDATGAYLAMIDRLGSQSLTASSYNTSQNAYVAQATCAPFSP